MTNYFCFQYISLIGLRGVPGRIGLKGDVGVGVPGEIGPQGSQGRLLYEVLSSIHTSICVVPLHDTHWMVIAVSLYCGVTTKKFILCGM